MKVYRLTLILWVTFTISVVAQDWEPRTHFTGYINAVAEYSDLQKLKKDFGLGLSEIGFLATFQPTNDIEFKAALVYTHYTFHVSQLLVEGYGKYHFDDGFKLTVGRFLTPLSPVNLYFYAPMNPSGVVPMLVSHHFLFPQSISGLQVDGLLGSDVVKLGYNASIGMYPYINHFESGIIGLQAQEDSYPTFGYYDTEADKINNYLCGTARLYGVFNDVLTLGANYFTGDAQQVTSNLDGTFTYYPSTKYTYGFDAHLTLSNLTVNAEYWSGRQKTTEETDAALGYHTENKYEAYYGEVIYDMDFIKPFFRWDFIEDINVGKPLPTNAATIGFAFRPRFETLIKIEYKKVMATEIDMQTLTTKDHDYNHAQISFVLSF